MTTRWDVERAALAEDLQPSALLVLLVLLALCDQSTAVVPDRFSPSLTGLVRMTGLARSTVAYHLNRLEAAGWLVRKRPTLQEARTKHARTRYALRVPKLVRTSNVASPDIGPELVRSSAKASPVIERKINPNQNQPARERAREDEVLEAIQQTLREVAPDRPEAHTRDWATKVAASIQGGRDRVRYVAQIIRNGPEPYLPTRQPPVFRAPQPTT